MKCLQKKGRYSTSLWLFLSTDLALGELEPLSGTFLAIFFRSLIRGSRVRNPSFFKDSRSSGLISSNALEIPWRIASACPVSPPPVTRAKTSIRDNILVISSGALTWLDQIVRGKYSSRARSFTRICPEPAWTLTLAIAVFRFPVAFDRFSSNDSRSITSSKSHFNWGLGYMLMF